MNKVFFILALVCMFSLPVAAVAAEPVSVEVLYMNHGPLRSTINSMKELFATYGGKITVGWHDFDTQDGEQFMRAKKINEHVPLMVWINGKTSAQVDGTVINFLGFPSGTGPASFQGKWTLELLKKALDTATKAQ